MPDDEACYEDIEVGTQIQSRALRIDRDEMIEFARRWDPRAHHIDEKAGARSIFGGLIASGALTTAIFTRLSWEARRTTVPHAVICGLGAEMKLPNPVRPGDEVRLRGEIIEKRDSGSRADAGIVRIRSALLNQRDEVVYETTTATLVRKRSAQPAELTEAAANTTR